MSLINLESNKTLKAIVSQADPPTRRAIAAVLSEMEVELGQVKAQVQRTVDNLHQQVELQQQMIENLSAELTERDGDPRYVITRAKIIRVMKKLGIY